MSDHIEVLIDVMLAIWQLCVAFAVVLLALIATELWFMFLERVTGKDYRRWPWEVKNVK